MTHPLNTWTMDIDDKRNLLKHGKINALLDKMSADAIANVAEVDKEILDFYQNDWYNRYKSFPATTWGKDSVSYYESQKNFIEYMSESQKKNLEELFRRKQVQIDALAIANSIRKYAPFIEVGAMTIAEAISCEKRGSNGQ